MILYTQYTSVCVPISRDQTHRCNNGMTSNRLSGLGFVTVISRLIYLLLSCGPSRDDFSVADCISLDPEYLAWCKRRKQPAQLSSSFYDRVCQV